MEILFSLQPLLFLKIGVLALLFLYGIFSFIVFIQVLTMNRVIFQPPVSGILAFIGFFHLLLAFSLFFLSLGIL